MQYLPRKAILALVVSSSILLAFMLLVTTNTITNVSAVEAYGVGVYWDSNYNDRLLSIDWGNLKPGSVKNIVVYARNEAEEPIYLIISTKSWNPSKASDYITLRWDYNGQRVNPGETLKIKLILFVSRYIKEISIFSFDITIIGSQNLPGDINRDGYVNIWDLILLSDALWTVSGEPNYNPNADINKDDKIDVWDLTIMSNYWLQKA